MKYVANWSGLFKAQKVISKMPSLRMNRQFAFSPIGSDESKLDGVIVSCMVNVEAVHNWISIGSSTVDASSLLACVPALHELLLQNQRIQ